MSGIEILSALVIASLLLPPFRLLMLGLMRDAKADRMPPYPLLDEVDDAE